MRLYFSQQVEKGFHVEQGEVRELKMILVGSSRNRGFPGGSDGKESACNAGDPGLILGSEKSPGEGNGYPFRYSCLGNPWTEEPGRLQFMG